MLIGHFFNLIILQQIVKGEYFEKKTFYLVCHGYFLVFHEFNRTCQTQPQAGSERETNKMRR